MRVLLDTHVWLWMLTEPERLGESLRVVEDSHNQLLLSAVSSWEIAVKYGLGRLDLPSPPQVYVPERIRTSGVTPLPIEHSHTLAVAPLPHHHRDPFDRLLIAQSKIEDVPILTADAAFTAYQVEIVPAR
ncbi:MAG: type II toxin-antitoxin system VapC family toxin [Acidimicrobiia bacterium]